VNKFALDPKEADGGCELNNLVGNVKILCTVLKKASISLSFQNKTFTFPLQAVCLTISFYCLANEVIQATLQTKA
jgi:hypothetical protein